jgi:hypothetical protein
MVNARFEIGTIEKHTIKVTVSDWTAKVQIWVDDLEIVNTHQHGLGPKSYEFQVGNAEKHNVEMKITVTRRVNYELLVDGVLVDASFC